MFKPILLAGQALVAAVLLATLPQPAAAVAVVAYDTTAATSLKATSNTALNTIWGERILLSVTGALERFEFSLYNGASSAGNLDTAHVLVKFFDGPSFNTATGVGSLLGSAQGIATFSPGLPPGFYSLIGLSPANLAAPLIFQSNDIFVTQTILAKTGPASRLGIVGTADSPSVGTSYNGYFFRSNSSGTGQTQISGSTTNLLYFLSVTPVPSPLPVFGAMAAFRWSRRLRQTARQHQTARG